MLLIIVHVVVDRLCPEVLVHRLFFIFILFFYEYVLAPRGVRVVGWGSFKLVISTNLYSAWSL
jgi:hypothetical protein